MKKTALIILLLLVLAIFLLVILPSKVEAWGGDLHDYLCPEFLKEVPEGCGLEMGPLARIENHLF